MKIDNLYLQGKTALLKYEEEKVPKIQNIKDLKETIENDVIVSITRENNLSAAVNLNGLNDAVAVMKQISSAVASNPQITASVHSNLDAEVVANLIWLFLLYKTGPNHYRRF